MPPRKHCPACGGDGKCRECFGSGVNVHLNQDEPKCMNCSGSGECPDCHGTGRWSMATAILEHYRNRCPYCPGFLLAV